MGRSNLETGFVLDRLWHCLRGEMERSKQPALVALARVLAEAKVPYAVIGGIALQVHQTEPRTTLDIDVAVSDRSVIPRQALAAAGFSETGRFPHSENWIGPESTPVQFTDDPALRDAIAEAIEVDLGTDRLRVIDRLHLLREKIRAGSDPARRRSKRLQDFADAESLIESDPALADRLSEEEKERLRRFPG